MKSLTLALILLCASFTIAHAQNWPQFRGPGATGVNEGLAKPVKWDASTSENVRWKLKIPGLAHSSPVVWGNKVFVTTAVTSGAKDETRFGLYGDVAPVKDDPKHTWKVYALDKTTGRMLWSHDLHGEYGVIWGRGYSCSPIAYGDTVILVTGKKGRSVMAFNQESGAVVWEKQDFDYGPGSPILITVEGARVGGQPGKAAKGKARTRSRVCTMWDSLVDARNSWRPADSNQPTHAATTTTVYAISAGVLGGWPCSGSDGTVRVKTTTTPSTVSATRRTSFVARASPLRCANSAKIMWPARPPCDGLAKLFCDSLR